MTMARWIGLLVLALVMTSGCYLRTVKISSMTPSGQTLLEQEWKERHLFQPRTWLYDDSTGAPPEQAQPTPDFSGPQKKQA